MQELVDSRLAMVVSKSILLLFSKSVISSLKIVRKTLESTKHDVLRTRCANYTLEA